MRYGHPIQAAGQIGLPPNPFSKHVSPPPLSLLINVECEGSGGALVLAKVVLLKNLACSALNPKPETCRAHDEEADGICAVLDR